MESRGAIARYMSVNERKFIEAALASDLRVDGRNALEYRKISIKFGREDGSSDVQLGQTRVLCFVTCELVQPYRDRPNEGTLSIFIEFSPMADPSFEPGRPSESAVELARVIERGLRESRAMDTESLCVLSGKSVWAIRVYLHIIDNGGNLIDAANIAALAALLTFRRPECSLGGEDGQQVIVHPVEEREPIPLMLHHLPIAVTFTFFGSEHLMVADPSYIEEACVSGRMTCTVTAHGDICSIQKPGGEGVKHSDIMRCLRLATKNAEIITKKIKDAVEEFKAERAMRKIKRHPVGMQKELNELPLQKLNLTSENQQHTDRSDEVAENVKEEIGCVEKIRDSFCTGQSSGNQDSSENLSNLPSTSSPLHGTPQHTCGLSSPRNEPTDGTDKASLAKLRGATKRRKKRKKGASSTPNPIQVAN